MFEGVAGDDLHHGDVSPCEEADQPHRADNGIDPHLQPRQTLGVKSDDLQHGGEDQRQEAAADRAHQRDDEVQLGYEDGQSTWKTETRPVTRRQHLHFNGSSKLQHQPVGSSFHGSAAGVGHNRWLSQLQSGLSYSE